MLQQSPDKRPSSIAKIKAELISHGNQFVAEQKLSTLKGTVIPASQIDDPLITDPIKLMDFDWNDGILDLRLSARAYAGLDHCI